MGGQGPGERMHRGITTVGGGRRGVLIHPNDLTMCDCEYLFASKLGDGRLAYPQLLHAEPQRERLCFQLSTDCDGIARGSCLSLVVRDSTRTLLRPCLYHENRRSPLAILQPEIRICAGSGQVDQRTREVD